MNSPLQSTTCGVIIPAAGAGRRFGSDVPKQYFLLNGKPIIVWTVLSALRVPNCSCVLVAAPEGGMGFLRELLEEFGLTGNMVQVIEGSTERVLTVGVAVEHPLLDPVDVVVVHDAVRPLVPDSLWVSVIESASVNGAAIPFLPISDTVKSVGASGEVAGTVDRSGLVRVQTPQAFHLELIRRAYRHVLASNTVCTDCASAVEAIGYPVQLVPGVETNIKITTPYDLRLAGYLLATSRG